MIFAHIIKVIIAAFFGFLIVKSFVSNFFANQTIGNVNLLLISKKFRTQSNYPQQYYDPSNIENSIVERNIFNITGEIPKEDFEFSPEELTSKNFYKVPCAPDSETLPVELLGIIYTGNSKTNLVTVQDPDVQGADVYHENDPILDYNDYSVYRIVNSNLVEFRHGAKKICRSLYEKEDKNIVEDFENNTPNSSNDDANAIVLTQEYVNEQLGTGLSKIVNSARIIPFTENGNVEGFKLFSIAPNSLFEKIGLMNGDIVTQVNNQKLTDPSKGFVIYDSFQYEHEITFTVKRGAQIIRRKVIIK